MHSQNGHMDLGQPNLWLYTHPPQAKLELHEACGVRPSAYRSLCLPTMIQTPVVHPICAIAEYDIASGLVHLRLKYILCQDFYPVAAGDTWTSSPKTHSQVVFLRSNTYTHAHKYIHTYAHTHLLFQLTFLFLQVLDLFLHVCLALLRH